MPKRSSAFAVLVFFCAFVLESGSAMAWSEPPTDDEIIATFQENRSEFIYWKDYFVAQPGDCVWRKGIFGRVYPDDINECDVDTRRLGQFMSEARVDGIYSVKSTLFPPDAEPAVAFGVFTDGPWSFNYHSKSILFNTEYDGPFVENLDVYSLTNVNRPGPEKSGRFARDLGDGWYMSYYYYN